MNYIVLKIIAIISMFIDHYGAILSPNNIYFRIIGRISFPLFCFLLINGYNHTSNINRYLKRLIIFSFISQPIFSIINNNYNLNVFFTLYLGLFMITFIKNLKYKKIINILSEILIVLLFCYIAFLIKTDYNVLGILTIYFIYKSNNNKIFICLSIFVLNLLFGVFINKNIQYFAILCIPFIIFFRDEKVKINKIFKYVFYWFYPLHLLILYIFKINGGI